MNPIIKYLRVEGSTIIIIPTAKGIEYLKYHAITVQADKAITKQVFTPAIEMIGDTKVHALQCVLSSSIVFIEQHTNIPLNKTEYRFYTQSQTNYFLRLPFGVVEQQLETGVVEK